MIKVTLVLIVFFTIIVSILGIFLVCVIKPGAGGGFSNEPDLTSQVKGKKRVQEYALYDVLM